MVENHIKQLAICRQVGELQHQLRFILAVTVTAHLQHVLKTIESILSVIGDSSCNYPFYSSSLKTVTSKLAAVVGSQVDTLKKIFKPNTKVFHLRSGI